MNVKAIVFDYGRVLTYDPPLVLFESMASKFNQDMNSFSKAYFKHRDYYDSGKINGKKYWQLVGKEFSQEHSSQVIESLIKTDLDSWFQLLPESWQLAKRLKQKYITAILSNNIHELVEKIESEINLETYFDQCIFSNRLEFIKPDPKIYHYCCNQLDLKPEEIIFIDDKIENIEAAQKVGMSAIQFTNYQQFYRQLSLMLGESI